MWKLVQCHEYITQEGINSQLRAHSILSPFVTCTFYNKLPAKSCIAAYLKVPSMKLLSHRGTDWLYPPNPKKHQYFFFFFSQEKIYYGTTVSRRHFLPIKHTASFSISFCGSILFLIEVCLMREKKPHLLWVEIAVVLHKNYFVFKINHLWWFSALHCTHCGLHRDYILLFFSSRQKIQDL